MEIEMRTPWEELPEFDGAISNFDFSVDAGVEDALRSGKYHCHYAGWNFSGYVWFENDRFKCEVWTYNVPRQVIAAETLDGMMRAVSSQYGYE